MRLIEIDDAYGAWGVVVSKEFRATNFGGHKPSPANLHAAFPSIYGPVELDWMLRTAGSGLAAFPGLGYAAYFPAKFTWNVSSTLMGVYDEPNYNPFHNMFTWSYLKSPGVVTIWLWGRGKGNLRKIFAPAMSECECSLRAER